MCIAHTALLKKTFVSATTLLKSL